MEIAEQMLEDFLVFLAKEGLIECWDTHGAGRRYPFHGQGKTAKDIIAKYWEGFQ